MSASVVLVIVHCALPSSWLQFNHDLSFAQGLYHESFAVEDQCAGTSYYCSAIRRFHQAACRRLSGRRFRYSRRYSKCGGDNPANCTVSFTVWMKKQSAKSFRAGNCFCVLRARFLRFLLIGIPFRCSSTFCSGSYPEGRYTHGFEEVWRRDRPRAGRAGT